MLVGTRPVGKTTSISQLVQKISVPSVFESADGVAASEHVWIEKICNNPRQLIKEHNIDEYLFIIDDIQQTDIRRALVKRL